ncbi:lycopene cyclase family protein [Maribacter flavus]|uniref:Lycopene cyclase n=1 Tax=Maribacter flavus TaxID=1658664 RepID=A0A5B2TXN2_9FLAO|nr:lycopene cyclase family protein [Maribacter flavus]KAA2219049.1 lycopene cyclase [Maribacter flavus]
MAKLDYDYIIIGAGASGLLLADALGKDSFFAQKSILLLDRDAKKSNDRTWCFWEKGDGAFDDILYKKWKQIIFKGQDFSNSYDIAPYSYKMVRGIDFYAHYFEKLEGYPNIRFQQESVIEVKELESSVSVHTQENQYTCQQVFDSRFHYEMLEADKKYPLLQQHFVGWIVKTQKPVFEVEKATYMDFSVPQKGNTRFMYVLPFKEDEALVEYTLFSKEVLPKSDYEAALRDYIRTDLQCDTFEILEQEQGSIPMTCHDFTQRNSGRITRIGTAGGWAKPSTGYTFMGSSKKIPLLVSNLKSDNTIHALGQKKRFWFYDLLLLDVLYNNNAIGHEIFTSLFKKRKPELIFKFLDEETSFGEELQFISGCPNIPFIKAIFKRLF